MAAVGKVMAVGEAEMVEKVDVVGGYQDPWRNQDNEGMRSGRRYQAGEDGQVEAIAFYLQRFSDPRPCTYQFLNPFRPYKC